MIKHLPVVMLILLAASFGSTAFAQQSKYPMMAQITQMVIQKYQNSSCQDLRQQKSQAAKGQQTQVQQAIVRQLRNDAQMRAEFLHRVAGPIANKLFECGMIP